jgi:tetratricopeptide (TPR) repeat protein
VENIMNKGRLLLIVGNTFAYLAETLPFPSLHYHFLYQRAEGFWTSAHDSFSQSRIISEELLADVTVCASRLADCYYKFGDMQKAYEARKREIEFLEKAKAISKNWRGLVNGLANLAAIVRAMGDKSRNDEIEALYQRAITIAEKVNADNEAFYRRTPVIEEWMELEYDPRPLRELGPIYWNFAHFYQEQGNYAAAALIWRKKIDLARQENRHNAYCTPDLRELACCLSVQGKHAEAEEIAKEALRAQNN